MFSVMFLVAKYTYELEEELKSLGLLRFGTTQKPNPTKKNLNKHL